MGGQGIAMDKREAASALRWWLEAGVDVAIQEQPRNWLERALPPATADEPKPSAPLPDTLEAFRQWLSSNPDAPLYSPRAKPILPVGTQGAEIMVLCESPAREDHGAGLPIGGAAAELMKRMLAAIGLAESAYVANLSCFHSPGTRASPQQLEQCAQAARRHILLARPARLLLLGDAPCLALLGKLLPQARGHVHKIEGVRAVATFHPRFLLDRSALKAEAWKDLLLLMEESR
jgi:DNA polymerase